MGELSEMEKKIMFYAREGIMAERLSWELVAPWPSIQYALNKLIAAGLVEDGHIMYHLTDNGKKLVADALSSEEAARKARKSEGGGDA